MEFEVSLGSASRFELKGAIIVYSGGHVANRAFTAWHDAQCDSEQAPQLGPAKPLSTGFLRELSRGLGAMTRPEVLPENVLVRTLDTPIWWRPAWRRRMFFRHDDPLGAVSGKVFPHPAPVFKVSRRELWIRALSQSKRPTATSPHTSFSVRPSEPS
jgi:PRTRC genetic system protein B